MKNRKFAKLAVVASALSLVMCCTMLLGGGTFAWFTDSVSSDVNTIQSGNLDMEVSYKPYGSEYTEWKPVTETESIFNDAALYEPGYTEAVWLKVENAGSLAFKFEQNLQVIEETLSKNVYGGELKLSDYLVVKYGAPNYDYVMAESFNNTREKLLNNFTWKEAKLSDLTVKLAENLVVYSKTDAVNSAYSTVYLPVVIQMPTTVGNEANYRLDENDPSLKAPAIKLGVELIATQVPYEKDAFDINYDVNATAVPLAIVEDADEYEVGGANADIPWGSYGGLSPMDPDQQMESVYVFKAVDTVETVATSPYKDWPCDYYVSVNAPLEGGELFLGGYYESFNAWVGFDVTDDMLDSFGVETLEANTVVPLMGTYMPGSSDWWTYERIVANVGTFICGVADHNDALSGKTFTVELRLTNPNNPDEYKVASKVEYTF